jgi:hypothetical protein
MDEDILTMLWQIVGLTRSLGLGLKIAADIELNCILTAFVSRGSGVTVASESNVLKAVDMLLSDEKRDGHVGQVVEVAMKGAYFRRQADWPDEEQRWMGDERAAFATAGRPIGRL